ncbi:MAG: rhomboid family intramembrane serine protease, partial [Halanaeroarchaeum sp.]
MDTLSVALRIGVPIAVVVSILSVWSLDRPGGRWGRAIRSRFLLGVPWGTLTVLVLVALFYLVVQGGYEHPTSPLHLPFTSWSYLYPLGMVTAPFAHQSLGHVTGNLLATLAFAPLAEFAFSHFPRNRGDHAFGSPWTNPFVRAFAVFPGGAIVVGLLTSILSWGPIIGFSGVVYAFAGFALVRFPIGTVVALIGRNAIGTLYRVIRDPIVTGSADPSFGGPWWAGIAIQGHVLGFLLGAVLGTVLLSRRQATVRPSAIRLWTGGLLVGTSTTMWAIWWYADEGYVLYRGAGMLLVVTMGLVVAGAVRARDIEVGAGITRRDLGIALLVLPIVTMGFVAVPVNAVDVGDTSPAGPAVTINDYSITYAEEVPNQRVAVIELPGMNNSDRVNASGVIVTSERRFIWTEAISASRLAFAGKQTVVVGGVGWRRSVTAVRRGWTVTGGETAYQVALRPENETLTWLFTSSSARASPTIAGQNVSIRPEDGSFLVTVTRNQSSIDTAHLP